MAAVEQRERGPGGASLRASSVSRSYAGVQALRSVSLELWPGEVVGLIGPNGAGKSTLVNVLSGFDRPTEGRVLMEDRDVTRWSAHRRGRHGLARTFQHSHAFRGLTVRENVEVSALGVGASGRAAARRTNELLALLGLAGYADRPASDLSHGDERRLGVARALATEPRFVLMDEPAAGLPEAEIPRFAAAVNAVRDRGAGVLLVDHNVALVLDVCERIHVLDQGTTLAEGSPQEIRADLGVAAAYLGESAAAEEPTMNSLALEKLSVRYGAVDAVRGLSLEVKPGQIVGLIGPNGAGKSSTLHAIMGSAPVVGGDVLFEGRSLVGRAPEDVARRGIALVPEGRRIFGELTVEENLRLGLAGRRKRSNGNGLSRAYELFPVLHEFRSRHAGVLSGGQQQQLAIGRALAAEPDLLLLDEPSLGLAPKIVDIVFEALAQIRSAGLAVLLVEQRAQRTVALSDRSHVLANGELRLTLGPQDAGDTDRLVAAYLA